MKDKSTTLLSMWFQEVWNKSQRKAIDELLDENVIANGLGQDGYLEGIDAFKSFYDDFRSQLSDIEVQVEMVVSEEDMESALCKVTGVHNQTGKRVNFSGLCMVRILNGKIKEAWNHYDFLGMYQQTGYELVLP